MKKNIVHFLQISIFLFCLTGYDSHAQGLYTEQDIYAYIDQYKSVAVHKMQQHHIPASITMAQGILESACGKSRLASEGNNHFGIKCHENWEGDTILVDDDELQECFRKYESAEESYNDHSLFLKNRKRYANLFELDVLDYESWAKTLKADGYATNPKYPDLLIGLIERFQLAKLDTAAMLGDSALAEFIVENHPVKTVSPATPEPPAYQPPAPAEKKVFTALGNDYPAGNSPFTYRKVFENNKTYFVIAKKGDTYESIAGDVQVSAANIRTFNDADENTQPVENEIVYIEAKGKNNPTKIHIVVAGETLRYISQRYGVQLQYIFKYNNLNEKSIIHPGDQILLRH
ncbi:MAG: glucosaminidase domain-containing protein [Bacteroidales bacterium]|nr:glucosaminidase domain-containing protein [Bacteroidales bacterium]